MISSLALLGITFCEKFVDWKEKQNVARVNAFGVEEKSLKSSLLAV